MGSLFFFFVSFQGLLSKKAINPLLSFCCDFKKRISAEVKVMHADFFLRKRAIELQPITETKLTFDWEHWVGQVHLVVF